VTSLLIGTLNAGVRFHALAEIPVPRELFEKILRRIDELRPKPAPV
jgi:hypothetical protein